MPLIPGSHLKSGKRLEAALRGAEERRKEEKEEEGKGDG